jgi:D-sedoheptulose 7-phosphate isomerase
MSIKILDPEPSLPPEIRVDVVDRYLEQMRQVLAELPREAIWQAIDLLVDAGRRRSRIYIVGNGGSAATASHMANDLNKQATVEGRPPLRAIALTDNMPLITAWSNDLDFAEAFAQQLSNHLEPGDLVVGISTSGQSPNVLRALELAGERGAQRIGLTGREGGRLAALVDCCLHVPSDDIGQQEDVHLLLNHVITSGIRARLLAERDEG